MTTLLVSSGGGHLQEMMLLKPRFDLPGRVLWASPDSGLAGDVLPDEDRVSIPYFPPRSWRGTAELIALAFAVVRRTRAERVITTGGLPGPPFLIAGAQLGLELHYIESATRSRGPSLAGRLAARIPSVSLYAQYPEWASARWRYAGSVYDPFSATPRKSPAPSIKRVVVTLGTEDFCFRRALVRILAILPSDAEVVWQTGFTDTSGLGINGHERLPAHELRAAIARADVVVSHAGAGTAATAFEQGKVPVMLPREAKYGEHVDDHQSLICDELGRRGLVVASRVEDLTFGHLQRAASMEVVSDSVERPFRLARQRHSRDSLWRRAS